MVGQYIVAGTDEQQTLQEALKRLRLPREAVEYDVENESEDELLPGAKPQPNRTSAFALNIWPEHARQHVEGHAADSRN